MKEKEENCRNLEEKVKNLSDKIKIADGQNGNLKWNEGVKSIKSEKARSMESSEINFSSKSKVVKLEHSYSSEYLNGRKKINIG